MEVTLSSVLCIISVYRPDLLERAVHALGTVPDVEVIMDRRVGERRASVRANSEETRLKDRRRRNVEERLLAQGFAIVPADSNGAGM
jgi:hypothetical protein